MSSHNKRPQGGGILPSTILKSLDDLLDRINNSNEGCSNNAPGGGSTTTSLPILALLVGTNEGIPLSRSYGTIYNHQQTFISDEVLSSIETIWATLPSAIPPHVKNAMALCPRDNKNVLPPTDANKKNTEQEPFPNIKDPPHPLLSHLGLGDHVKTTIAFYDYLTLIHVHMAPLVVTILASSDPNTNIGAIKLIAVPYLHELLEPVRNAMSRLRYKFINGGANGDVSMMTMQNSALADSSSGYYHG
eukprot:CAMPEP_0176495136 /NCGR_PEP_ID=MMETSP0200_2-20121128/10488_1 /TAXON_ID=947934 /ORGANISM="Chaetoceros sp., Strain GSL56" /LENGTH=245 /DNA_ID=CAMNT_0017892979 /DNA_START=45 /DNA_END=782 /DNA_ORIENTATION=+